jgi:thiamine-phosphate pyrophosphorylase
LYPIIDVDTLLGRSLDVVEFARSVLTARPMLIQLRAKSASAQETLDWLRALRPLATAAGALLFANDRPDLAVLAGCDGVHVGQHDLRPADVRRFSPELAIGISTHDVAELEVGLGERPFYVAFGPVFATGSKQRPDPVVGVEGLAEAARLSERAGVPLVAIGGITLERAASIAATGAAGAVIAGLLPDVPNLEAVSRRALDLQRALCERT